MMTISATLRTTLRSLRLSGLAASLDLRLQEATGHQLTYMEFLELILASRQSEPRGLSPRCRCPQLHERTFGRVDVLVASPS